MAMCSNHVVVKKSNEAEVLAILEALSSCPFFNRKLVVESNSSKAVSWVCFPSKACWRFHFFFFFDGCRFQLNFNEIVFLISLLNVDFHHVSQSANEFTDNLAKQGVKRSLKLVAINV